MPLIPTAEQRTIQFSKSKFIIAEANAGATKTTTAGMRIDALIRAGADPKKVHAFCYSSPGVTALRSAFKSVGISAAVEKQLCVGTVDEFCVAQLETFEWIKVVRFERPEQIRKYVLQAIAEARTWAATRFPGEFSLQGTGEFAVEGFIEDFAQIKGSMAVQQAGDSFSYSPSDCSDIGFGFTTLAVFKAYERIRRSSATNDGEQVLFRYKGDATFDLARLLDSDDPQFTSDTHPLRLGIQAVVFDEMHDCNRAIFTVLKEILRHNGNASFLGIGDRDQVIHARDGADAYFMRQGFKAELGHAELLPLTQTHRFGAAIAAPLGRFAGKAYRANPERSAVVSICATTMTDEIVDVIVDATTTRRGLDENSTLQNVAVLLRHPGAAVELEHQLIVRNVPYEAVGFKTFLERPEVLFVRMMLTVGVGIEEKFGSDLFRGVKRSCVQFLEATLESHTAEETQKTVDGEKVTEANFRAFLLPDLLKRCPIARVATQLDEAIKLVKSDDLSDLPRFFKLLDIKNFARRQYVRAENIDEVEASIAGLLRIAGRYESIGSFLRALLQYDRWESANKFKSNRIVLSTIADSKGLEFDHVIIAQVNAREFDGDRQDERNLFYVAASRARNQLTMTHQLGARSSYLDGFGE